MTIFTHKVPANMVGVSTPAVPTVVNGSFAVQDVSRGIYAMKSNLPVLVGWVAATADGQSGIQQLARGLDATYNWQSSTTGFGASGNTSSVTVQYPSMQVLWNGSMQPVASSSWAGTPSNGAGVYSFCVSYQWGLNQFALIQANFNNYVELAAVNVTATSATIQASRTSGNWMGKYWVSSVQTESRSNGIPYSDANGNMSW